MDARERDKNTREFERKLIADWLRFHVSEEVYNLIYSGDYRHRFASGILPDKNGNMFKPFEAELKALERNLQADDYCTCVTGLVTTTVAVGVCGACHKPFPLHHTRGR